MIGDIIGRTRRRREAPLVLTNADAQNYYHERYHYEATHGNDTRGWVIKQLRYKITCKKKAKQKRWSSTLNVFPS